MVYLLAKNKFNLKILINLIFNNIFIYNIKFYHRKLLFFNHHSIVIFNCLIINNNRFNILLLYNNMLDKNRILNLENY